MQKLSFFDLTPEEFAQYNEQERDAINKMRAQVFHERYNTNVTNENLYYIYEPLKVPELKYGIIGNMVYTY